MLSSVVHGATRLIRASASALALLGAGQAHAITPGEQQAIPSPPAAPYPSVQPREGDFKRPARPAESRPAHKVAEPHGKPSGAKPPTGAASGGKGTPAPGAEHATVPATVPPAAGVPPAKESGEPPPKIPRFEALKTDDTNMRKGPGQRYPIEWVYKRQNLPMEVEREYDVWRYVRDPDGVEGWVHSVTLSERRTFMVRGGDATMRADASDTATPVATLKAGVIGRLRECDQASPWCQVQAGGYKGYLRRDQLWGLLPDEVVPWS